MQCKNGSSSQNAHFSECFARNAPFHYCTFLLEGIASWIPVDHAHLVAVIERDNELLHEAPRFILRQIALVSHVLEKVASRHILQGNTKVAGRKENLPELQGVEPNCFRTCYQ